MILELARLLKSITLATSPLYNDTGTTKIDKWTAPKYWAEVEYRDITTDGLLRHTTFRGLYASRAAKKPLVAKFKQERAAPRASGSGRLEQEEDVPYDALGWRTG